MEKGLVHIYCGDGKGKTSAAIGLAVRAAAEVTVYAIFKDGRFRRVENFGSDQRD